MNEKRRLEKTYDPKPVEEKWSQLWDDEGLFVADPKSTKPKFSMVLPPPNVTGILHMGHALCFTLPDIITRWKRMQGYNCLWLPGTDHASIAVHNVIEQSLAAKGLSREKIGRDEFLRIAWDWKEKYGGAITGQLRKLGASLDWSRERFTMDPGFTRAVKQVFVSLYDEGLIYRDYYLVNRCPRCRTVLSDIEIEHRDLRGKLWYIKYPVEGSDEAVVVATTRPETMLGDTAVAVHPDDERFRHLHGRRVLLPLQNRLIPVITDERVEREFGTGAVKVTPAHDPVDFELGKLHDLEQVIVIDGSGRMTEAAGPDFQGLDRFECRAKVVEKLRGAGASRQDRRPRPRRWPLLPLQERHRALSFMAVVRPDQAAGRRGHPGRRERRDPVHPAELDEDLLRVDVQYPRLVHLAPALVGPPDPGLVLPGLPAHDGRHGGAGEVCEVRRAGRPGRGRPRHLVLVSALAVRDARLARRDRGPPDILPHGPHVHRASTSSSSGWPG